MRKAYELIAHAKYKIRGVFLSVTFDKSCRLQYSKGMQSVLLRILDDSKTASLLGLLRDLSYVEICSPDGKDPDDVYAGIPSKLDDDLQQSQLGVLEKVDW